MQKKKKQEKTAGKPFGQSIQLVTLSNALPLISESLAEDALKKMHVFHNTQDPKQPVFLKPDFTIQGLLRHGRKQKVLYIQVFRYDYIDGAGNKDDDVLGNRFYERIAKIDSHEKMYAFLNTHPDFCVFPTQQETAELLDKYEKIIGARKYPVMLLSRNEKGEEKISGTLPLKKWERLRDINTGFLYGKIGDLKKFLEKWLAKELDEDDMAWLNKELEKVSPTLLTFYGHALEQLRSKKRKTLIDTKVGTRKVAGLTLIHSYRIYGHFALCCLRIFHEILNKSTLFVCERCGKLGTKEAGSKMRNCSKEQDLECFRQRERDRQYKAYHKKK